MSMIQIVITDATGARQQNAMVPSDVPAVRIIARVVELLNLPLIAPDGQPMSYRFHHAQSSRQVRDEYTLADAGVAPGDTLRIVPEITAGATP